MIFKAGTQTGDNDICQKLWDPGAPALNFSG